MSKHRVTLAVRAALAAAVVLAAAGRASAGSILLSNVQVRFDEATLIASITAGLEAQSDDGGPVFLDALAVSLSQDGAAVPDLFSGPTLLDDLPFFALPYALVPGDILPPDTLLFRLTGLAAGAAYTGSFSFLQFDLDGGVTTLGSSDFAFSSSAPAPVPEPGTLILTSAGLLALLRRRVRRGMALRGV